MGDAGRGALIAIDIQECLLGAMPESARAPSLRNAAVLLQAARAVDVPVLVTEQYPAGLSPMHRDLHAPLPDNLARYEKTAFSCCAVDPFMQALQRRDRRQAVSMGLETHVRVLQTAAGLRDRGYRAALS